MKALPKHLCGVSIDSRHICSSFSSFLVSTTASRLLIYCKWKGKCQNAVGHGLNQSFNLWRGVLKLLLFHHFNVHTVTCSRASSLLYCSKWKNVPILKLKLKLSFFSPSSPYVFFSVRNSNFCLYLYLV